MSRSAVQAETETRPARHFLTVLFSDLSDSTGLAAAMEPEIFGALLERLRGLMTDVVARHGGEIVRIDGDGVICIFGFPDPVEDGGRRAAEAALDLHRGAARLDEMVAVPGRRVRLHSGIHSGVVLVSPGDLVRGRYEILGDATNIAAHLCDLAAADEIVASEAALGLDLGFFTASPRRLVTPRGATRPFGVHLVTGRAAAPSRREAWSRRAIAPLTGRESEIARLLDAHAALAPGAPRLSALIAPSGMGKTRLLDELAGRLAQRGTAAHRGYCEAYLGASSLQPAHQFVRSILAREHGLEIAAHGTALVEAIEPLVPGHGAALARWLGPHTDESAATPAALSDIAAAIVALIDRCNAPVALIVDDWQWADDASAGLIETLLREVQRPLLLVLAARDERRLDEIAHCADIIRLPPLDEDEARHAIRSIFLARTAPVPTPFLIEQIVARAGGCPLFIEELCHSAGVPGAAQGDTDGPSWLEALIQARFAALPTTLAELVVVASVIGHIVPIRLFEAIAGAPLDDETLGALSNADFIYPGDDSATLRFKHILTRDAVYRIVGLERRRALHARIAAWLAAGGRTKERFGDLELLAYHCIASGDMRGGLGHAMAAGERAMATSALDRAQTQYLRAFTAYKALPASAQSPLPLADLISSYGRACVVDPSRDQIAHLQEMVAMAREDRDETAVAIALYWLGSIHYGLGQARASIALLDQALPIARRQHRRGLETQIVASLGQGWFDAGQCDRAEALLSEAIADMQRKRAPHIVPAYVYAVADRAQIFAERGTFERAEADFSHVADVIGSDRPAVMCSLLTKRSGACIWLGDYAGAIDFARAAEELGLRNHSRINVMIAQALAGYAGFCQSGDPEAAARLVDATRWLEAASHGHRISLFFGWACEAMAALGDVARARALAARAFARARVGDGFGEGSAARALARLAPSRPGRPDAGHYLAIAYRSAERRQSPRARAETLLCEAEITAARGEIEAARRGAHEALSQFRAMEMEPQAARAAALATSR